ncbi:hypothetical protein ONZ43_g94 [Nemania bipapillata]|uniref:Uncharacterized protein n=1 Tax=Nemania bipapillata TaxID=110536 RepID=A0ACC2J9D1_9PEZI|nr:hypothetical protein ONZ43_g94 [Nemania bipapillata]
MPPATTSFFKQSRTKMQAWVTNNHGFGHSQPGVATSAPAKAYDPSPDPSPTGQTPTKSQPQVQTETRHVNIPQPQLATAVASTTQQTLPGRSRSPIINANSQRVATVTAARILAPPAPSHSFARDESRNLSRARATSSEPLQQSKRPAPFWEGSTIEGSAFSDTASNIDSNLPFTYRQPLAQGHPALSYQQHDITRHGSVPKRVDLGGHPAPLVVGPNGLINMAGTGKASGLTRSASTLEGRSPRGGLKEIPFDITRDSCADDSPYNTSPEKTPSAKRLQHPKTLALRPTRRESYSGHTSHPSGRATAMLQSSKPRAYLNPSHDEPTEVPQAQPERQPRLQPPANQPHRSTIFADTDTPVDSLQDGSEDASIEREPTPVPIAKPSIKARTQVNRQLFVRANKGNAGLRESAIPLSSSAKPPLAAKKRSLELDYDDGALAAMDYVTLKSETFDFDPAQAEARSVFEPLRGTLPEKLDHFFTKDEANQINFFTKMPVKDWEDSGDWFLERFGDIVARFKKVRKEKRALVNAFESEIAEREEAVRNKISGIEQTLADMKSEGEEMMLGKEFS